MIAPPYPQICHPERPKGVEGSSHCRSCITGIDAKILRLRASPCAQDDRLYGFAGAFLGHFSPYCGTVDARSLHWSVENRRGDHGSPADAEWHRKILPPPQGEGDRASGGGGVSPNEETLPQLSDDDSPLSEGAKSSRRCRMASVFPAASRRGTHISHELGSEEPSS